MKKDVLFVLALVVIAGIGIALFGAPKNGEKVDQQGAVGMSRSAVTSSSGAGDRATSDFLGLETEEELFFLGSFLYEQEYLATMSPTRSDVEGGLRVYQKTKGLPISGTVDLATNISIAQEFLALRKHSEAKCPTVSIGDLKIIFEDQDGTSSFVCRQQEALPETPIAPEEVVPEVSSEVTEPMAQLQQKESSGGGRKISSSIKKFFSKIFSKKKNLRPDEQVIEGTLSRVIFDDFEGKTSTEQYRIFTSTGEFIIDDAKKGLVKNLIPESVVRIRGNVSGTTILPVNVSLLQLPSEDNIPRANQRQSNVKKTAVILFNFSNNTTQNSSPAGAKAATFGPGADSLQHWMEGVSNGQHPTFEGVLDPAGDVFGWYTLPDALTATQLDNVNESSRGCMTQSGTPWNAWRSAARDKAAADGFIKENYDLIIYAAPLPCARGGGFAIKHEGYIVLAGGGVDYKSLAHEYGHILALDHSNALVCDSDDTCTTQEYGDRFNAMGGWNSRSYDYTDKTILGWIPTGRHQFVNSGEQKTVQLWGSNVPITNGIQEVAFSDHLVDFSDLPAEANNFSFQGGSFNTYYTLEYRKAGGYDDIGQNQIIVRREGLLIDMHPATPTFEDAGLFKGESVTLDGGTKISWVTSGVQSPSGSFATVVVDKRNETPIDLSSCRPKVSITQTSSERRFMEHPEEGRTYEVWVDTVGCGDLEATAYTHPAAAGAGLRPNARELDITPTYVLADATGKAYLGTEGRKRILEFTVTHEPTSQEDFSLPYRLAEIEFVRNGNVVIEAEPAEPTGIVASTTYYTTAHWSVAPQGPAPSSTLVPVGPSSNSAGTQ